MFGLDYLCTERHLSGTGAHNSCRVDMKPNHRDYAVSMSFLLPPLSSAVFFPSPFRLPLFAFPFLLFESDTEHIFGPFLKWVEVRPNESSSYDSCNSTPFTSWPLHDYSLHPLGTKQKSLWFHILTLWWPCVCFSVMFPTFVLCN